MTKTSCLSVCGGADVTVPGAVMYCAVRERREVNMGQISCLDRPTTTHHRLTGSALLDSDISQHSKRELRALAIPFPHS